MPYEASNIGEEKLSKNIRKLTNNFRLHLLWLEAVEYAYNVSVSLL
jgi:hypothetical protein